MRWHANMAVYTVRALKYRLYFWSLESGPEKIRKNSQIIILYISVHAMCYNYLQE